MHRYLLAGCAAVALTMASGVANAQAKFEVKVGGDAFFEWGYVDQDNDANLRSSEMRNRFRVNIIPSAKADNGLEYGGRIRIRADNNNAAGRTLTQDRAYIFAQGGFGQIRAGTTNTYNDETIVSRPIDYLPFGLFDQGISGYLAGTANGTDFSTSHKTALSSSTIIYPTFSDVATRVVYFSPRIAGLQLGASYTPRNDDSTNSVNRIKAVAPAGGGTYQASMQDLVELGANYNATFGGFTVKAGAGYYTGEASDVSGARYRNLNAWQAGAQLGYAGFTVGGSYTDWGKSGARKGVANVNAENGGAWQVGAQYTVGPIVVGGGWMYGKDSGDLSVAGKREVNVYEIGVSYTVAPGLAVQAQYDYFDADSDIRALSDKGSVIELRTTLAF